MGAKRQHAHKRQDIFKKSHEEIIKSAKRKHSIEFYIFKSIIGTDVWYSESCIDAYGSSVEHWVKKGGRWSRVR